ncbi:MAG: hypothetical protein LBT00_13970, partial [Spirochaetaceae bacterium]|nr:hypothetical protein [Spirochaetaceae bacterium]
MLTSERSSLPSGPRHCERSEAIQGEGLPRLDCFVVGLATEGSTPPPRNDKSTPHTAPPCHRRGCRERQSGAKGTSG